MAQVKDITAGSLEGGNGYETPEVQVQSEPGSTDSLEAVVLQAVPDAFDYVPALIADASAFCAFGVLLALLAWVTGYTVSAVFSWLENWSK